MSNRAHRPAVVMLSILVLSLLGKPGPRPVSAAQATTAISIGLENIEARVLKDGFPFWFGLLADFRLIAMRKADRGSIGGAVYLAEVNFR